MGKELTSVDKPSTHQRGSLFLKPMSVFVIAVILLSSFSFLSYVLSDESNSDCDSGIPARSTTIDPSSFVVSPMAAFVGEVITFTATATSDEGTTLTFTIFYDFLLSDFTENPASPYSVNVTGNPGQIKTEYVYDAPGPIDSTYRVRLSITDGAGAVKNFTRAVAIYENTAPYFAPDLGSGLQAPLDDETFTASLNMSVTCWDADNDDLSLTWDFGDGSEPIQQWTGPALVGVECVQNHTWSPDPELWYGVGDANITYYINLSLTDGLGHWKNTTTLLRIPLDHNFSPKGNISVLAHIVDPADIVTIYGNASDAEGEPLTWTFVFANELAEVIHIDMYHTGPTEPGQRVFQNTTYVFSVPGDYTVTLYITDLALPELQVDPDFAAHNVSVGSIAILSIGNRIPSVTAEIVVVDYYTGSPNILVNHTTGVALVSMSIQAIDLDGEVLYATWDFGDGSELAYNTSLGGVQVYDFVQIHEFSTTGLYNVSVVITDGRPDHEVLRFKLVTVASDNESPEIRSLKVFLSNISYGNPGSVVRYEAVLYDYERDPLEVSWDFGDGSPFEWTNVTTFDEDGCVTLTVEHVYSENGTYMTWVNFTDRIYDLWGYHQESYGVFVVISGILTNEAPVADAGPDRIVLVGTEVTFDGSGSIDDFGIASYTWTFTYDAQVRELDGENPKFTFNIVGGYVVTLTVLDGASKIDTDTVLITVVAAPNEPPVADAGPDQVVALGDTVTFDGGESTGDIVSYSWTFEHDGDTETLTGESPTFAFDIAGTYTVTLTVEDSDGVTDEDTVTITVESGGSTASYDLALGVAIVLIIVALALFLGLRGRKGGRAPTDVEDLPEEPTRP